MANTEEVKSAAKGKQDPAFSGTSAAGKNGGVVAENENQAASSGDGWVDIQTDQPMYKADSCKSTPLVGYMLFTRQMPEGENGPWEAYVVKLTQPCLAVDGFDEGAVPKTFPKGTEVLINATAKLREVVLGRNLIRPGAIVEVRISPTEKVKIGGGRTLWRYNVQCNEKSVKVRSAAYALPVPGAPVAALPPFNPNNDIPF